MIVLKHSIKQTGEHKIHVKLKEGVEGSFMLKVNAEEAQTPSEKPAKT